jgi:hypothetical protein
MCFRLRPADRDPPTSPGEAHRGLRLEMAVRKPAQRHQCGHDRSSDQQEIRRKDFDSRNWKPMRRHHDASDGCQAGENQPVEQDSMQI